MMVIIVCQYAKSLAHLSWGLLKGFSVHLCHSGIGKSLTIITHLILVKSTTVWVSKEVLSTSHLLKPSEMVGHGAQDSCGLYIVAE